ncbi:MAG: molybdopterin-dependent oxidoreductase [Bacteroidales bacterium]|jgi:isoquinoline 1-oxidoreductase|nr:molybdopterin-dependent oxidoreductase [Bacteroidales bacterium]
MKKNDLKVNSETTSEAGNGMKRRSFLKIIGGGIIVFFQPWGELDIFGAQTQRRTLTQDYNAFLQIAEDGTVSCFTGKIEMGQGVITSLAQMMADELNVPLEKVKMVMGDTDLCPYDAGTWGSQTTQTFGPAMRAAAAEARGVLVDLAAARLGVPASQLEVRDGFVVDSKNPKRSVSYASLAKGKKLEKYLDVKPAPEDYTKFTYVGKPLKHSDALLKVTGKAKYTGDLKLPGMLFARILRPPSHGARLSTVDVSEAEKVVGTQVVRDGDFIAVLNENKDRADEAIVKIKAEYTFNELKVNDRNLYDRMVGADSRVQVLNAEGDLDLGYQQSDKLFESEFHDPYLAHAPIETHTALAKLEGDKMTVWASTQSPFGLQDGIVRELGYPREKVRVITPFVGGGFGGKAAYQQGVEAARLAKLTGKPIMLVWTRDEEFFYDTFHPAGVVRIKSGIDKNGFIKLWDYSVYYGGTRGSDTIYNVPNAKTTSYSQNTDSVMIHPFGTGPWRAPNNNANTFARESQIDIMAAEAGTDPLEFRLKNLSDEKMIACWKAVAEKFGYVPSKTPGGRGIGMACGTDAGTWVATIVEVNVDKTTGKVRVLRVASAQDMGLCVNPQGALIQMEGCIQMALGYTFTEEILFEGGNVKNRGFDAYEIPRFSWTPKIDCVILDRLNMPPKGGGEPAIITVGAAVANAIFDATGARLYRMPMTPARVLEAIKKV